MSDRAQALDDLYILLAELEVCCGGRRRLISSSGASGWPVSGVYFFFEAGELRADGVTPRVVRVGTHRLRPSSSTLWGRLSQHRGNVGAARPGGGNHRGSIFRLHVGTALLKAGDWRDDVRASWGRGSSAGANVCDAEYELEGAVSAHIGAMPLLWLPIDDPASAASDRGVVEAGSIALLSNYDRTPLDPPSPHWLGRDADGPDVVRSGLWNVNHVREEPSYRFLEVMRHWLCRSFDVTDHYPT